MKTKLLISFFLVITIGFTLLQSCSNSDSSSGNSITINGVVVDENNNAVAGAAVKCGSVTGTTDGSGAFSLANVPFQERTVVEIIAIGFFDGYRAFNPTSGGTQLLEVMMESKGTPINFSATSGSNLSSQGGVININPNSVMDQNGNPYSGTVTAYARFHNPSQSNFSKLMQGGDLAGENAAGETGVLSSQGFYSVEMEDNVGAKLNIKTGSTANFSIDIAASQIATAPSIIKLWSFDKTKGMWKEEGEATKSGNSYIGQVSHFSAWNMDTYNSRVTVKGKIECTGVGVSKLVTVTDGVNIRNTTSSLNGQFSINIPSNTAVTLTIQGYSNPITITPQVGGSTYDTGTTEICTNLTLSQVLASRPWKGNTCFNNEIGNSNYTYVFHTNNTFSISTTDPLYIPISWSLNNNQITLVYGETGQPSTCSEVWTVNTFNINQITLNPTLNDCGDTYTVTCGTPLLLGQ